MDGLRLILIFIAAVDVLAFILIFWILDINTYLFPIIKVLIRVSIIFLTYYFFVRVVKKLLNLDDKKKTVDEKYNTKISSDDSDDISINETKVPFIDINKNCNLKDYFDIEKYNGCLFFSYKNKSEIEKVVLCPKGKEHLYQLPKGCYIRINKEINNKYLGEVLVVEQYNSYTDEIVVSLDSNLDSNITSDVLRLKVNDILEVLNINHDVSHYYYCYYYHYHLKNIKYMPDTQSLIPSPYLPDILDEMFRLFIPYAFGYSDKNGFIEDVLKNFTIKTEHKHRMGEIYDFFLNKIHRYLSDYFMYFIVAHEFDDKYDKIIVDLCIMYRNCKVKLHWMTEETIKEYVLKLWYENASIIYYKPGYGMNHYEEFSKCLEEVELDKKL